MALPATDNFNRADAGTLGSNWTDQVAGLTISSNLAYITADLASAFWNADTFGDDQYSKATKAQTGGVGGPIVRASGTGGSRNLYLAGYSAGDVILFKCVAGSFTNLQQVTQAVAMSDVLEIRAVGTTLSMWLNNVQFGSDTTDSSLASGSAGLYGSTSYGHDDWEGGNISGGSAKPWLYRSGNQML